LLPLAGHDIDQPAAGTHISDINDAIQQITKVVRGVISVLPYVVGYLLAIAAVMYAMDKLNWSVRSTSPSGVSRNETVLGRKLDARLDLQHWFGQFVQATHGYTKDNVSRTQAFLRIHDQRFIARRSSKPVPISDHVIAHLDTLAQADGFSRKHVADKSI